MILRFSMDICDRMRQLQVDENRCLMTICDSLRHDPDYNLEAAIYANKDLCITYNRVLLHAALWSENKKTLVRFLATGCAKCLEEEFKKEICVVLGNVF